jgi:hypothetical protein
LSSTNLNGQSDTRRLAAVLGWLAAIALFAAGLITALLQFDITASPPRKTAPNDLLEGTLASFQNESDRWPQEVTSLILFTVGFLALIGLVALLRNAVSRDDPWMMLGTLAIGVGAGVGAVSELLFLGAKEVGIDPHYCDCARAAEQIISRGQTLGMFDNAQRWLLVGTLVLASAGLLLIWRATSSRGLFGPTWRGLTLALALVMAVAVITTVAEVDVLSDVVTAIAAAILTPVWAVSTARGLPVASRGSGVVRSMVDPNGRAGP